jgi:hypothetical protein
MSGGALVGLPEFYSAFSVMARRYAPCREPAGDDSEAAVGHAYPSTASRRLLVAAYSSLA